MSSAAGTLARALKQHQAGALAEARRLYWRVLSADPHNAEALHLLGVTHLQTGRPAEAEEALRKALGLDPGRAEYHHDLGEVLTALRRPEEARACFEEAIRLRPDYPEAFNNLGLYHQARGDVVPALRCFHRAMQLRPNFAEPYNHSGILAFNLNQPEQALTFFRTAVRLRPDYAAAHSNLGIVLLARHRLAEAAACFHEALRLQPRYAQAHNNLGIVHQVHGQFAQALACFDEALRLDPQSAQAHNNKGGVLRELERFAEALACYQRALEIDPGFADARANLCQLLKEEGRHAEAVSGFEQALKTAPSDALKLLSLLTLPVIPESADELRRHRRRFEDNLARLRDEPLSIDSPAKQLGNLTFYLAYHGENDREIMTDLAAVLARATPSLTWAAPHCARPEAAAGRRLRVVFVSRSFFNHTIARLTAGLVHHLPRQRFHVSACTLPGHDDEWWKFIRDGADASAVLPLDLHEARRQVAGLRPDVLVYPDIGMDPWTYFLAFARLAPVQCVTWGHPVTTGIPAVDYFLSARDLEPDDADGHYSERLVRLEHLPAYYYRPKPPAGPRPRRHFGLDDGDRLYLCPQSLFKLHPDFDAVLDALLRADPRGRIVLLAGHQQFWTEQLLKRLRGTIGERADRVVVLPRQSSADFLRLLALVDVVLDPTPFGGGNTTYEALAVGSPVVTLPGRFMRGRVTYACYRRMGVTDCVAADADDYVRKAVRLANDPAWRAEVCDRIRAASGVLFENPGILGELEEFFVTAYQRATGGAG